MPGSGSFRAREGPFPFFTRKARQGRETCQRLNLRFRAITRTYTTTRLQRMLQPGFVRDWRLSRFNWVDGMTILWDHTPSRCTRWPLRPESLKKSSRGSCSTEKTWMSSFILAPERAWEITVTGASGWGRSSTFDWTHSVHNRMLKKSRQRRSRSFSRPHVIRPETGDRGRN
jgi:hypothetical protein